MCDCFTRREFVGRGLGLIGLGWTAPSFLARTVLALDGPQDSPRVPSSAAGGDGRVLVVLQLAGGNDGLNTVIPYRNDDYYRHRPKLAVEGGKVHRIDDDFAFHPSADGLKRLYDDGILAVVHGVGYPNPSRSHFVGTEIWETADPQQRRTMGWVGRYFDAQCRGADPPDPKAGVALVKESPTSLIGARFSPVTFTSPDQLDWRPDRSNKGARALFEAVNQPREEEAGAGPTDAAAPRPVSTLDFLRRAALDARVDVEAIRAAAGPSAGGDDGDGERRGRLEHELVMVARLIAAGLPTRVYYVSLSGFDTHANQSGRHAALLKQLGDGLTAFMRELKSRGLEERVLLMTFSEFGRRVTQNASGGTDHGKAAPMFLVGSNVAAGLHGRHPGLRADQLDRGDLQHTTDFRSVYATVLREWLAADARDILAGEFGSLPLLRGRGRSAVARPSRDG